MAMKTSTFKGTGIAMYPRLFEDNRETMKYNDASGSYDAPCDKGGSYILTLNLDADEFMELRRSGSMMCKFSKIQDDGSEQVKLRRYHEPKDRKGKVKDWMAGPPKVLKADGTVWDFEDDGPIWNGAKVEYEISLIDYPKISGVTTLEKVKVLENGEEPVMADESEEVPFY